MSWLQTIECMDITYAIPFSFKFASSEADDYETHQKQCFDLVIITELYDSYAPDVLGLVTVTAVFRNLFPNANADTQSIATIRRVVE